MSEITKENKKVGIKVNKDTMDQPQAAAKRNK